MTWVRTSTLREYCDPFKGCWPELDKPLTIEEVQACLDKGKEQEHKPFELSDWWCKGPRASEIYRSKHIQKVAWFARHGFQKPIDIDVGIPSMNCYVSWFVQDGNHRLAAAIFRQVTLQEDPWIPLSVAGSVNYAKELNLW